MIVAIDSLKNHKAPGKEFLSAELFKSDPVASTSNLQPYYNTTWDKRKIPNDWNQAIIVMLPKEGALSEHHSWLGFTLLSIPNKILVKVIMKHLSLAAYSNLANHFSMNPPTRNIQQKLWKLN